MIISRSQNYFEISCGRFFFTGSAFRYPSPLGFLQNYNKKQNLIDAFFVTAKFRFVLRKGLIFQKKQKVIKDIRAFRFFYGLSKKRIKDVYFGFLITL